MKSFYYFLIFMIIVTMGIFFYNRQNTNTKYKLSDAQKKVNNQIGEGIITINDLKYNVIKDVDFNNKQATIDLNGKKVKYTILDILQPFDIDKNNEKEYPFLIKAEYPDNTKTSYLVIAQKKGGKFISIDQIKVGNPDKIEEIYELDDHEVIVEAIVGKNDNQSKAHLSYTLANNKIVADPNNIDIDNYELPAPNPLPTQETTANNTDQNINQSNNNGGGSGKVALSFDDGPGTFTSNVLDALKSKEVKATFFMIGENTQKIPDFVKRVHSEGHEIGNHTWDHSDLSKLDAVSQKEELQKTNNAISSLVDIAPHWFRPPYGNFDNNTTIVLSDLGMQKVLWNVDTRDWSGLSADEIYSRAVENIVDGSIILMHDGVSNSSETAKAVPRIIDTIRSRGFELVTISNL